MIARSERQNATADAADWPLMGVDFTSRPRASKPIVVAHVRRVPPGLRLAGFEALGDMAAFDALLARPGPWVGGFDLPFGLPRDFVVGQGWPTTWGECMSCYAALSRQELRDRFRAWCDARPAGSKFAHRRTDRPAGSSPSMKWVNPPVAWMMHAGVPRLRAAGVSLPGLAAGDPLRVAVEAYPGMVARRITGASYKSDARDGDTPGRRDARRAIVDAVAAGAHPEGCPVVIPRALRVRMLEDAQGDTLDALLCALLAAWCATRAASGFGRPVDADPLEGWIAAAG